MLSTVVYVWYVVRRVRLIRSESVVRCDRRDRFAQAEVLHGVMRVSIDTDGDLIQAEWKMKSKTLEYRRREPAFLQD